MASEAVASRRTRQPVAASEALQCRTLLGQRLWQTMVERGVTCDALAASVGMSAASLREFVDSRRAPSREDLVALAALLGCEPGTVARIVAMQPAHDRRLAEHAGLGDSE